jgi:hypothetical protein
VVLEWYTKEIVGYYAGRPCTSKHCFAALEMAVTPQWPNGARGQEVSLMSDNGCQPTSLACGQAYHPLGNHRRVPALTIRKAMPTPSV